MTKVWNVCSKSWRKTAEWCEETAHSARISRASAYRILTERWHKRRIDARWVPHGLSEKQTCRLLEIAQQLLHRFREEGNEFLQKVVAIDETWNRDFEPELKSQSSEWRGKGSPRPKKFKRAQSNVKQIMIFAYDCKGVIMTDRVPSGTTVTAVYYRQFLQKRRRNMQAKRPELLEKVSWFCMITDDPPLISMPVNCWTDTAGSSYPIRPTAPTWGPRTSTCTRNWKSTCVGCVSLRWRTFLLPLPDASQGSTVLETWRVSWTFQNVGMQSFGRRGTTLKDYNTLLQIWCSIL